MFPHKHTSCVNVCSRVYVSVGVGGCLSLLVCLSVCRSVCLSFCLSVSAWAGLCVCVCARCFSLRLDIRLHVNTNRPIVLSLKVPCVRMGRCCKYAPCISREAATQKPPATGPCLELGRWQQAKRPKVSLKLCRELAGVLRHAKPRSPALVVHTPKSQSYCP